MWRPWRKQSPPPQPKRSAPQAIDLPAFLARMDWMVLRRLDGLLQGQHRTLFKGSGLDLAELREYQAHDDVRHIDWLATARTGTPQVREHLEEREIQAWFLVDMSGSMDVGSQQTTKRERLLAFVAIMSRLMMMNGNRVGAIVWRHEGPDGMTWIPARMGRRHTLHVLQKLSEMPPPSHTHASPLDQWLRRAARLLPRRAEVFVLSDFLSDAPWEKSLAELAQRHDGIVVHLTDPLEQDLPALGSLWIQDAESGEQIWVDSADDGLRARYAEQALRRRERLVHAVRQAGMDALELSTAEALHPAILRFVQLRQHKWRHA